MSPESASAIYSIQKVFFFADVAIAGQQTYQLYKTLEKRTISLNPAAQNDLPRRFLLCSLIGFLVLQLGVAIYNGSKYEVLQEGRDPHKTAQDYAKLSYSGRVSEFFCQKAFPGATLGIQNDKSHLDAAVPDMLQFIQLGCVIKLTLNLLQAYYSPKAGIYLANAALVLISLVGVSKLKWIRCQRWHDEIKNLNTSAQIQSELFFLVPSYTPNKNSCCKNAKEHQEKMMKSIICCSEHLFDDVSWSHSYEHRYKNGEKSGVGGKYYFEAKPFKPNACSCALAPEAKWWRLHPIIGSSYRDLPGHPGGLAKSFADLSFSND